VDGSELLQPGLPLARAVDLRPGALTPSPSPLAARLHWGGPA
jgi:hypothetical protein